MEICNKVFETINNQTNISELLLVKYVNYKSILVWRPAQSGKTEDIIKIAEVFHKDSVIVEVCSNNRGLAEQNTGRHKVRGFSILNYQSGKDLAKISSLKGKKVIVNLLMEIHNLKAFETLLFFNDSLDITLVIDEGDMNKTVSSADTKKTKGDKADTLWEEDEENAADGSALPPVTMILHRIKNLLKARKNSRTIFVSASPLSVLTAEKDDWLTLFKEPYDNYVSWDKVKIYGQIMECACKSGDRWTNNYKDLSLNTYRAGVDHAISQFVKAPNKCLTDDILQICLITLESIKASQELLRQYVENYLVELNKTGENVGTVGLFVMNGDTKSSDEQLSDLLLREKIAGKKKVIVIASNMASRGVSFTDYSTKENRFELILQVHYTKKSTPINSALQITGRVCGPPRRTVSGPAFICNHWAKQDFEFNFPEYYRMIREVAEFDCATLGRFNPDRPLAAASTFRHLKITGSHYRFIAPSLNPADHLPIVE